MELRAALRVSCADHAFSAMETGRTGVRALASRCKSALPTERNGSMDFNPARRNGLLRAYTEGQLEIDGLVSCASLMGLSTDEVVCLLEEAAESEPSTTRNGRLHCMLVRGYRRRRLTLDEVVSYAVDLGFETYEIAWLLDEIGRGTKEVAA